MQDQPPYIIKPPILVEVPDTETEWIWDKRLLSTLRLMWELFDMEIKLEYCAAMCGLVNEASSTWIIIYKPTLLA
jgi:hypothetical protein